MEANDEDEEELAGSVGGEIHKSVFEGGCVAGGDAVPAEGAGVSGFTLFDIFRIQGVKAADAGAGIAVGAAVIDLYAEGVDTAEDDSKKSDGAVSGAVGHCACPAADEDHDCDPEQAEEGAGDGGNQGWNAEGTE